MEDVQTVSPQLEALKHARVGKNLPTTSCCGVSVIVLGHGLRHHQGRRGITGFVKSFSRPCVLSE